MDAEGCKHAEEGRRTIGVVSRTLEEGAPSTPIASKLRGRLQFADGQLLGRVGRLCLKAVTEHACSNTETQLSTSAGLRSSGSDTPNHSLPRKAPARRQEPLYMFTDASYEPPTAPGRAALAVSCSTQWVGCRTFSSRSPTVLDDSWPKT